MPEKAWMTARRNRLAAHQSAREAIAEQARSQASWWDRHEDNLYMWALVILLRGWDYYAYSHYRWDRGRWPIFSLSEAERRGYVALFTVNGRDNVGAGTDEGGFGKPIYRTWSGLGFVLRYWPAIVMLKIAQMVR